MQIDSSKVTVQDIQKYETLMNGIAIGAYSNAHSMVSNVSEKNHSGSQYFTKHHWVVPENQPQVGPLEMQFEYPTSLISLNIEMTFSCNDTKALVDRLKSS